MTSRGTAKRPSRPSRTCSSSSAGSSSPPDFPPPSQASPPTTKSVPSPPPGPQQRPNPQDLRKSSDLGGLVMDLTRHRSEQRRDRGVLADGLGDHVDGAVSGEEFRYVEPAVRAGQNAGGQGRVGHERQGAGHHHPHG